MPVVRKQPPATWVGPVKRSSNWFEIWAAVPQKVGDIRKVKGRWITPDGVAFINSQDASEYMLKLVRVAELEAGKAPKDTNKALLKRKEQPKEALPEKPKPAPKRAPDKAELREKKKPGDMSRAELLAAFEDLADSVGHLKGLFGGKEERGD